MFDKNHVFWFYFCFLWTQIDRFYLLCHCLCRNIVLIVFLLCHCGVLYHYPVCFLCFCTLTVSPSSCGFILNLLSHNTKRWKQKKFHTQHPKQYGTTEDFVLLITLFLFCQHTQNLTCSNFLDNLHVPSAAPQTVSNSHQQLVLHHPLIHLDQPNV